MRKFYLLITIVSCSLLVHAQPATNAWIPFSGFQSHSLQQYYKIPVAREGVYRINKSALISGLVTVANDPSFNHGRFQIFKSGVEQYIYVYDENGNNVLDGTDYIEFYGTPNDGALDTEMFDDPASQVNPRYSVISDTAAYFLTWVNITNPPFNTRRLQEANDNNFSAYPQAQYFMRNAIQDYYGQYYPGSTDNNGFGDPEYTAGEGWFDYAFRPGASANRAFNTQNRFTAGPDATLESVFVSASNHYTYNDHRVTVTLNGTPLADTTFEGYQVIMLAKTIPTANLSNTNNFVFTANDPNSVNTDRNAVSYIAINYPHTFSFNGESDSLFRMQLPFNALGAKSLTNITNYVSAGTNAFIYDLNGNLRIPLVNSSGTWQGLVPNDAAGQPKNILLFGDMAVSYVNTLNPVSTDPSNFARFRNFNQIGQTFNYIIVTHASLMSQAASYQAYRSTGGHNAMLVDVAELYDQFSYGVNKHPMAIRHFARYAHQNWAVKPKNLLLLGKSISSKYCRPNAAGNYPDNGYQSPAALAAMYAANLIPTVGYPASDLLLTNRIDPGKLYSPAIPTGRIAARTPQHVSIYLNKVMGYESQQPADWMKHVLHFGGGTTSQEQQAFKDYLSNYETLIEAPNFGGIVTTVLKTSSDPIQINQSELIKARIDSGVTMMTFFGHASGNSFDIAIDLPSAYTNKDKYPIIIANSCYAGDIHKSTTSTSEDFVLIADKGAIGFIAQVGQGFPGPLDIYSNRFYRSMSVDNYGGTIGRTMQMVADSIENPSSAIKTVLLEMTLHGDPALVLNSHLLPDFAITESSISFSPQNITTELDSFQVNIDLANLGRATYDTVKVQIKRVFQDGSFVIVLDSVANVYYHKTLSHKLPVDIVKGPGLNRFEITVDPLNKILEIDDLGNNFAVTQVVIQSTDISPAFPYDYSIVPNNVLQLKATTSSPFDLTVRPYVFELDTNDTFNSPARQVFVVSSGGGVVSTPSIALDYDRTYYWRVSLDSLVAGVFRWRESSFICKPTITGWSQAHFYQFKSDAYSNVVFNRPQRQFDFVTNISSLNAINSNFPEIISEYNINNVLAEYGGCQAVSSIHIAIIDSLTHKPWETYYVYPDTTFNVNHQFGNVNNNGANGCRQRPERFFIFRAGTQAQRDTMKAMINNVPDGHYVLAWTFYGGLFPSWTNADYQFFENLGADSIRYMNNYQPYIFFVQKGKPNTALESIGIQDTAFNSTTLSTTLVGNWDRGSITSTTIGPAKQWTSLHWMQHAVETSGTNDIVYLDVIGVSNSGQEVLVLPAIPATTGTVNNLSSLIDANVYPYLKLRAYLKDTVNRTPPQLDYWQVYYQGVPELALNPSKYFEFSKDTVQQGEKITMGVAMENISPFNMDSLLVEYYLFDYNRVRKSINLTRHRPVPAGDTIISKVSFTTENYPYANSLWVEANPANDQPEQYHYNNVGEMKFYATRDVTNPLLDVTFDGLHIIDREIVSSRPNIIISLRDENKFLAIRDTNSFAVFLTLPDGTQRKLSFEKNSGTFTDNTLLKWYPAVLPKNKFTIEYNPELMQDGIYELKVQGKDVSDNLSGNVQYRISFEVINKSTITHILNYPNPFSTSTKFVFTLTGSEVPTYFKIQILTVTGKVIREITTSELGPLRIGRNITEYAWDGTDEYGDKLANGLYLYRVITNINGKGIENRETEADRFFKSGFGKMYILR